jgi:hypothetical protein
MRAEGRQEGYTRALTAGPCHWGAGSRAAAALPLAPYGAPHGVDVALGLGVERGLKHVECRLIEGDQSHLPDRRGS